MLSGCVFFKGLFLCCHSSKMPKGIFSLKNHLWAKPKCGVMDLERTFWVVTSGWKQAPRMEIGFPPLLQISPIVNFLLPSLKSDSRCTLFLSVHGRSGGARLFVYLLNFAWCHLSLPIEVFKISPGEQRWGPGWTGRAQWWRKSRGLWSLTMWQAWVHLPLFIEPQFPHLYTGDGNTYFI